MNNKLTTHLWFDKEAREAADFYVSVFGDGAKIKNTNQLHDTPSGDVDVVNMEIFGQDFTLISAGPLFKFNEAISFIINCEDQQEIDYYWGKLSAVPESEQCDWLKDKYGLSWQVVPKVMDEMMTKGTPAQIKAVTESFLKMKKFDVAELDRVYKAA